MMKTLGMAVAVVACFAVGSTALAKGGSPQTHHCKLPDGTMDMAKTKAECKTAKGTWAKDAAAEKPAAAAAEKQPAPAAAEKK